MSKRKVTWTKQATREFNALIKYIRKDSELHADRFKERLLNKINELSDDKVVHRKDPYKQNNDGKYLYFEFMKCRIVYYAELKEVFIIRIRHTSMEPKQY